MAGDWIKMRSNLWDDPRVSRLCDLTESSEAAVIGGLYWLWATADQHSEDGVMPGLTSKSIDRKTGVPGLGAALVEIGWISVIATGVLIERFEEHNGASAKKRATTAKRVANHRGNADVTQAALQEDEPSVTGALAREREEKEKNKTEGTNSACSETSAIESANAPTRAVDLSIVLRESGIDSNPADPRLQALADQGVSIETARAAAQKARQSKPNERISTGYVAAIITGWASDAAKVQAVGAAAPPGKPAKFDPVAFVNRNRPTESHERTRDCIDVEAKHVA
jgi:hypothetical protein